MKAGKTWMIAAPAAAVLMIAAYALAIAFTGAPYAQPAGTVIVCDAVVRGNVSGDINGSFDGLAGPATFEHTSSTQAAALIQSTELKLITFYHVFETPEWGEICVKGDVSRPLTSSVTAQQAGQWFPARSTRHFHANLTISSIPGVAYRTIDPVLFVDNNVTQWPQTGALYIQVGSATFERSDRPGVVALTVSGAQMILTAQ